MQINNSKKLTEASILSCIGIIFALASTYIPFFSMFFMFNGIPYTIIAARCGIRYSIMSSFISLIILMMTTNPISALVFALVFIPSIVIGYNIYKNENSFQNIALGSLFFIFMMMLYIKVSIIMFNIDIVKDFNDILIKSMNVQKDMINTLGIKMDEKEVNNLLEYFSIYLPSMLVVIPSIVISFINYYVSICILRRIKKDEYLLPETKDFSLPGNIPLGIVFIYVATLLIKYIDGIYYESIVMNLEMVILTLFLIQGACVYSYFLDKINIKKGAKGFLLIISFIIRPIVFIITIIGMLDSVMNFRKIRR
ncbi:YybS family protein [Tepidibacter sp. Z1-5]|uniref:YybS family protein n=1 Tax=Tepidibacter sp. Z1-5 TaxID=3134138 RepID=UPI0030BCC5DD